MFFMTQKFSQQVSPLGAAYIDSLFDLKPPGRDHLGEEELATLCSEAINAGTDTSATTVEWALLHMVLNQEMQERLYKEIVACVGKTGTYPNVNFQILSRKFALIMSACLFYSCV